MILCNMVILLAVTIVVEVVILRTVDVLVEEAHSSKSVVCGSTIKVITPKELSGKTTSSNRIGQKRIQNVEVTNNC